MNYTADNISSTLLEATSPETIDWQAMRAVARDVYSDSCFQRYAKRNANTGVALCAIVDDHKYLYRRVYVDGWSVWCITTMWLNKLAPGDMPDWLMVPFGTYPDIQ